MNKPPYLEPEIQGWMDVDELIWLNKMAETMESIVEIGSWKGRSTRALLMGCPGKVYAIDTFKGSPNELHAAHEEATRVDIHSIFMQNVGHFPNLIVLKMDSIEASKLFEPLSADMIFIDGDHSLEAFKADFTTWLPKTRKLICGHDLGMSGVTRALEEMQLQITKGPGMIWFQRLPEDKI